MNANQLTFTTTSTPEWNKKIGAGLRETCEELTGFSGTFKTQTIYALIDEKFAGGLDFEQHGDIFWIDRIWVELNFRQQSVGSQLIEKATQCAVQNNAKEIQLNTYFPDAHEFFLSQGFEDVAVIPNWKYGLDCYLMRKIVE